MNNVSETESSTRYFYGRNLALDNDYMYQESNNEHAERGEVDFASHAEDFKMKIHELKKPNKKG